MEKIGVPKGLFPHVIEFSKSISPDENLLSVEVLNIQDMLPRECIENVRKHIEKNGGEAVLGWKIWERYGLMIEGEFHTVWRSLDGKLYDVTPNNPHVNEILFVPDPLLQYEGLQIDNIRRPLVSSNIVSDFIKAHREHFEFMNRGQRRFQHGEIHLSDEEAIELEKIMLKINTLGVKMDKSTPGRNDFCRCGSAKKAKRCCFK